MATTPTPPAVPVVRPQALGPCELVDLKNSKFRPTIDDYVQKINDILTEKVNSGALDPEKHIHVNLELPVLSDDLDAVMTEVASEFMDQDWDFGWKPLLKTGGGSAVLVTLVN